MRVKIGANKLKVFIRRLFCILEPGPVEEMSKIDYLEEGACAEKVVRSKALITTP